MTQEMGESLIYSWLRHVKGCQIVQTNWKVSPTWLTSDKNAIQQVDAYISEIKNKESFNDLHLFGNSNTNQIIFQAECDVLGNNGAKEIFAVESAYHKGDLRYKQGNVKKVVEKLVKNAMCIYAFFGKSVTAHLIFATPKCKNADNKSILEMCDKLNSWAKIKGLKYDFSFICNENYNHRIIAPVLLLSRLVNDSSEMFLRSAQLLQLFGYKFEQEEKTQAFKEFGKVGNIANIVLRSVLSASSFSKKQWDSFMSQNDSKQIFGISKSLLSKEFVIEGDHVRSYATPIVKNNNKYYLYNNWKENQKKKLIDWIKENI